MNRIYLNMILEMPLFWLIKMHYNIIVGGFYSSQHTLKYDTYVLFWIPVNLTSYLELNVKLNEYLRRPWSCIRIPEQKKTSSNE